jgi:hypothetical protein
MWLYRVCFSYVGERNMFSCSCFFFMFVQLSYLTIEQVTCWNWNHCFFHWQMLAHIYYLLF